MSIQYTWSPCQCGESCGRMVTVTARRNARVIHRICQSRRYTRRAKGYQPARKVYDPPDLKPEQIEARYQAAWAQIQYARRVAGVDPPGR